MAPPTIKELIEEPFGPYPDSVILNPGWVPQGTKLPQLRCLRLCQNEQFIGLDTCERFLVPPKRASSPVSFFGVLIIEQLAWLSEAGKTFLKSDLNARDETFPGQRASQNSRKATQRRELTLEGLYGQMPAGGSRIKVWILCEKENRAMFMTTKSYPNSLILNSKYQHRSYEILTMDRPTYFFSSNFLERYRLVALIEEIAAKHELTDAEVDPFVNAYLMKHKTEALSYAVIFAEEGEAPVKPRLRHISHAEVRGIFAAHSGWLLAFYLLKKKSPCPINIRSWCEFIVKVRVAKRAPKSGNWSQTYEDEEIWASDEEDSHAAIAKTLSKFGGKTAMWEEKITKAITKRVSPSRLFDDDDDIQPVASNSKQRYLNYDPDFSEPSTPGCSDSEYDSDAPSLSFPPILERMTQPTLLPGRFIWDCPIPKCEYRIDFLNLEPQDHGLSETYVQRKQFIDLRDEHIETVLRRRVSNHYCEKHLGLSSTKLRENKQGFIAELLKKWQ
ncbi:hypothetical protein B0H19DRAFT_1191117 [Mycena capillaripes]|nr:hypothetical protein B0H19DRAFT_1191117 [Mycena capillaripes]